MKIILPIRPLSTNQAWQGRRFSTPAKTAYENKLRLMLPRVVVAGPFYRVAYDFHLIHAATTDWDNLCKVTQDCLVKRGIISDDCRIVEAHVRKFRAAEDRIEIQIEGMSDYAL